MRRIDISPFDDSKFSVVAQFEAAHECIFKEG
jgi:hypothetical protein